MNELVHHGIKNQKWGVRHGPPYPLKGGSYSANTKRKKYRRSIRDDTVNEKKHFDKTIKSTDTLNTLSFDPNRTKNTSMFFAAYTKRDKAQYRAWFNKPVKDANGLSCKYRIRNTVKNDLKVASEDSGAKEFKELFQNDRDFYNYVTDPERMRGAFNSIRYRFKGYREAEQVLQKMDTPEYKPSEKDLNTIYRMFNYTIPYEHSDVNARLTDDVRQQREKFFKKLKSDGYGAVLDVNDSLYGGYHAQAPVIVFDMEQIVPKDVMQTSVYDSKFAQVELWARRVLGL